MSGVIRSHVREALSNYLINRAMVETRTKSTAKENIRKLFSEASKEDRKEAGRILSVTLNTICDTIYPKYKTRLDIDDSINLCLYHLGSQITQIISVVACFQDNANEATQFYLVKIPIVHRFAEQNIFPLIKKQQDEEFEQLNKAVPSYTSLFANKRTKVIANDANSKSLQN